MVVAVIASLVGLITVLVALQRDVDLRPAPRRPDWDLLPTPADVARVEFPLAVPGYDPATVETTLQALADAYADLLAVCDQRTIERARHRAALRLDHVPVDEGAISEPSPEMVTYPAAASPAAEALRTEAALSWVEQEASRDQGS